MKQKIVATVVQGMLSYLNNAQVEKLQEVLLHTLWDYDISPSDGKTKEQEQDLLALFLAAKRIEGCSEKSLNYYQATTQAIVLPAEERVPALAPRCPQGGYPAPRRSAGYNTVSGDASSDKLAAAARKCRWGVFLRAVSKHWVGNSRPALCKCRPAAQIAIPYVILPLKISPAGLQRKMHLPFGYSLPKPKGRCECANF